MAKNLVNKTYRQSTWIIKDGYGYYISKSYNLEDTTIEEADADFKKIVETEYASEYNMHELLKIQNLYEEFFNREMMGSGILGMEEIDNEE